MDSGCYQLTIAVRSDLAIRIGSLGLCRIPSGVYVYTGSAMRNLNARVARHRLGNKKLRWHIDLLLADPEAEIVRVDIFRSERREECDRNLELIAAGAAAPVKRFGSTDCRRCPAHLLRV